MYADDFIVTGKSKEFLENEVLPEIRKFMGERGLELSQEKTFITHIGDGFDFLGQNIRKYGDTVLIKPSKDNTKEPLTLELLGTQRLRRKQTPMHQSGPSTLRNVKVTECF